MAWQEWLNSAASLATAVAALVAVAALGLTVRASRQDFEERSRVKRLEWATELLTAFEMTRQGSQHIRPLSEVSDGENQAWATFKALLRISPEDLPITRRVALEGAPNADAEPLWHADVAAAPGLGRSHESNLTRVQRAELCAAIARLQLGRA